jgi:hypothetical protein
MAQDVRDTNPAARVERDARRDIAAGLAGHGAWIDLRATAGPAAGDEPPDGATALTGDFESPEELEAVRDAAGEGALVTVFDTIEHLASFVGLIRLLTELSEDHGATVVLAVPNDAVADDGATARPGSWGEGAFAELRSVLPPGHVVWHQMALRGTAVVPAGHEGLYEGAVAVTDDGAPMAFLAAFGPRVERLAPAVGIVQVDVGAERTARMAADAELAYLRARVAALEAR